MSLFKTPSLVEAVRAEQAARAEYDDLNKRATEAWDRMLKARKDVAAALRAVEERAAEEVSRE